VIGRYQILIVRFVQTAVVVDSRSTVAAVSAAVGFGTVDFEGTAIFSEVTRVRSSSVDD
jgi:hypothetical protein